MSITESKTYNEINQLIGDLPIFSFKNLRWDLAVDLYEKDETIVVKMNIPGVDPDNVNVLIDNNHLHISGLTDHENEIEKKHYFSKQIKHGFFEKIIPLPQAVKKESILAEYEKGVLKIVLEKDLKKESPPALETKTIK